MNKRFVILFLFFHFGSSVLIYAQTDSIVNPTRIKIDGVAAVIGDYVILDSDIDKAMASPSASIIVVEVVGATLFIPTSFIFGIIKLYELICASLLF